MKSALLILLLPLGLEACGRSNAATPPKRPVAVRLASVSVERIAVPVNATGTLGLKEEVPLSFKVGGVVARILVDEGEHVRKGQTLAALDLGEIDPGVTRARSASEKAERDLARAQRLYADSVVTQQQVQDAQTARDVARADLEGVAFNRRHAEIVATSDGVILGRRAEPGELVRPGDPILVLGSQARGQVVRVGLADRDAARVHRGDPAQVRFDALPGAPWTGEVTEVAAGANPGTGTYRVEIALSRETPLASGLIGAVVIHPRTEHPVALVPVEAVLEADGETGTVFTIDPQGRARRRTVTLAFMAGDRIAIAAGLEGVERVVTDGAAYLDDGDRVEVRP